MGKDADYRGFFLAKHSGSRVDGIVKFPGCLNDFFFCGFGDADRTGFSSAKHAGNRCRANTGEFCYIRYCYFWQLSFSLTIVMVSVILFAMIKR